MKSRIDCLDCGYVELIDSIGSDAMVVDVAGISYNRPTGVLKSSNSAYIKSLASKGHKSPFYHPKMHLEVKMPIFVARQLMRHNVGIDWSEMSRRYCKSKVEVYCGTENLAVNLAILQSIAAYEYALSEGVKPEDARVVLPMGLYTKVKMTTSLYALANLIHLREDKHAQSEARVYARAFKEIAEELFPVSLPALLEYMNKQEPLS